MKFFRFVMAVAVLFGAVACSQSQVQEVVGNEEVTTTLSVALEDLGTRATTAGTAKQITNVKFGIYDVNAGGKYLPISGDVEFDQTTGKAEIEVTLFTGKTYDLVFWAYDATNTSAYVVDMPNRKITVNYGKDANDESRDAFFHIENGFVAGPSKTFTLKRPFAQLNAGQNKADLEAMAATSNSIVSSKLKTKAYNTLSLVDGKASNLVEVEFTKANVIDGETITVKVDGKDEVFKSISMNYLLLDKTKETVDVEFSFFGDEGTEFVRKYSFVPVQRNYRTNILGQLISAPSLFTILIDPIFTGDHNSFVEYPKDGTLEALIEPLLDQKEATIVLQSDVTWTTGHQIGSTPLIPEGSALQKLTIEGGVVSRADVQPVITFIGKGVGSVRAANGGTITFRNVKIVDESVSYAEDSWEYGYLEFAGKLAFENCTFVNAAMFEGENVSFNGCYFNSNHDNQYAAWVSNGVASFNKCVFEGWRGLKTHEAYGSEVATITVDDCDFTLTKKPGVVIGNVNADTTISIKDSRFNTPAGDQGLHVYESDTDVTTFNFTTENNTLIADTYASLEAAVKVEGANILVKAGTYSKDDSVGISASWAKNVTVTCEDGVVFKGQSKLNINGSTLIGGEFKNHKGNIAVDQTINGTFKKCFFNDTEAVRWAYAGETVVFEECIFGDSTCVRGVHFDGGANDVVFNKCTIYGFTALGGELTKVTFNDCKFPENSRYNVVNMFSVLEFNNCEFNPLMHCDCATNGVVADFNNCVYTDGSDIKALVRFDYDQSTCVVRFDGKLLAGCKTPYTYDAATKTYSVATVEALVAMSEVHINAGETIKLEADIDLAGVDFAGLNAFNSENNNTFDGQGHTIKNFVKQGAGDDYGFIRNWVGTIKNVTIEDANISGGGRIAILAGKPYGNIENCHIKNCTLTSSYWACGGLAGLYNSGSVSNCTAENVTVECGGGVGILIGAVNEAAGARNFTNCKVTNCNVIWGAAWGNDFGAGALTGMFNIDGASTSLIKGCEVTGFKINGVESNALYGAANGTVVTVEN